MGRERQGVEEKEADREKETEEQGVWAKETLVQATQVRAQLQFYFLPSDSSVTQQPPLTQAHLNGLLRLVINNVRPTGKISHITFRTQFYQRTLSTRLPLIL